MEGSYKPAVLAIAGPTATGKTALGVRLAKALGGEIISADSMQIYRGLDIGTAKVTPAEQQGVPHFGIDIRAPQELFSVAEYTALAGQWIGEITARGHLPILVGGTGLYLESLLSGIRFAPEPGTKALRLALEQELQQRGAEAMYAELAAADPQAAAAIHPHNTVRVLRALEHYRLTGQALSAQKAQSRPPEKPYHSLLLCLSYPDRTVLYEKIDRRVDAMMEAGLLAEAEWVYRNRADCRTAAQAIGYKEFFSYFEGTESLESCTAALKQASRNYAKRQLTWFRRMPEAVWLDAGDPNLAAAAQQAARRFVGDWGKGNGKE